MIDSKTAEYALGVLSDVFERCSKSDLKEKLSAAVELGKKITAGETTAADELYDHIDNEDDSFSIMQEQTENKAEKAVLDCIIYASAILVRYAYEKDCRKYFPEPIELVDESTVDALKCAVSKISGLS